MAAVGLVDYAAARLGCDAEECIQKALGDGEIGMCGRAGGGGGGYDVYRLTARAREANEYLRYVFRESAGGGGGVRVRGGERGGRAGGRAGGRQARLSAAGRAGGGGRIRVAILVLGRSTK